MPQWIMTYIASYLEDLADVEVNFTGSEALMLGMAGASVLKNIAERFLALPVDEQETTIAQLKGGAPMVEEDDTFVQQFIPSPPVVAPVNHACVDLVKEFEGCRLEAYQCPAGVWTIGYGHTHGVKYGDAITQSQAEAFLIEDLTQASAAVSKLVTVPLNENQHGALTSFVFNLGAGGLAKSTLLKRLNSGDYEGVPEEMNRWVFAGTKKLPGLVRRRAHEGRLFTKDV